MLAYALTDIGVKRKVNQDYVCGSTKPVGSFPNLFILADGMGGARGGDYASKYLAERLQELIRESEDKSLIRVLRKAVQRVNREIYETACSETELSGMGSTLVAAVIDGDTLVVANVGDSRLYIIGDGIEQITRDHSYVEEQVALGRMSRDSEEYRKNKHFLTRAVGAESHVNVDIFERELLPGEQVLMCSDGLTNMVDDDTILSIMSGHGSVSYKAATLIDTANENGGNDNIAVILINPEADGGRYV